MNDTVYTLSNLVTLSSKMRSHSLNVALIHTPSIPDMNSEYPNLGNDIGTLIQAPNLSAALYRTETLPRLSILSIFHLSILSSFSVPRYSKHLYKHSVIFLISSLPYLWSIGMHSILVYKTFAFPFILGNFSLLGQITGA